MNHTGGTILSPFVTLSLSTLSQMSVFSAATDLQTRRIVWVGSKRDGGQLPPLSAAEISNLATNYEGWQGKHHKYYCNPNAKRISFTA